MKKIIFITMLLFIARTLYSQVSPRIISFKPERVDFHQNNHSESVDYTWSINHWIHLMITYDGRIRYYEGNYEPHFLKPAPDPMNSDLISYRNVNHHSDFLKYEKEDRYMRYYRWENKSQKGVFGIDKDWTYLYRTVNGDMFSVYYIRVR